MESIAYRVGKSPKTVKNLSWAFSHLRENASDYVVIVDRIDQPKTHEFVLWVVWENGDAYKSDFSSYKVFEDLVMPTKYFKSAKLADTKYLSELLLNPPTIIRPISLTTARMLAEYAFFAFRARDYTLYYAQVFDQMVNYWFVNHNGHIISSGFQNIGRFFRLADAAGVKGFNLETTYNLGIMRDLDPSLPVGFKWTSELVTKFHNRYESLGVNPGSLNYSK